MPRDPKSSPHLHAMFDDEPPEPTPITNVAELFEKMSTTASLVKRQQPLIEKIPEIERKAEEARKSSVELHEQVVIVRTRQEDTVTRLERIERNGHPCALRPEISPRVEAVEKFVDRQTERQEKDAEAIATLTEAAQTFKSSEKERRALTRTVIAILATVVMSAGGSAFGVVWYVRGAVDDVQKMQEQDRMTSEHRDALINQRLKLLPTTAGPKQDSALRLLRDTFKGMTPEQRTKWCRTNADQLPGVLRTECPGG